MMNSYLITGYFILTIKMSTLYPQNGFTKTQPVCKSYAEKKKERKENEQFNDFSNTAFTTRVEMEFKI